MTGNSDDRQAQMWAMWCHLASLAWIPLAIIGLPIPFANIVGPLIFWVTKKEADPFINDQGKEYSQLPNFHDYLRLYRNYCVGIYSRDLLYRCGSCSK